MTDSFHIVHSNKAGLDSKESYVLVRNGSSFLRVLGGEPRWNLMTATADEDHGRIAVCSDKRRLVESALRLGAELDTDPQVQRDWLGREYVTICELVREAGESDEEFKRTNRLLFRRFFEIFDGHTPVSSRTNDEMRELYETLANDEGGEDVYLSDGMWLGSDGVLRDGGR